MAEFRDYLARSRRRICDRIDTEVTRICADLASANPWEFPLCSQLVEYTKSGKMVRGALVGATHALFRGEEDDAVVDLGAVMELIQSFLLIHDDMMDQDDTRRGLASIHARYRALAEAEAVEKASHFGESMSVCVGDVAYLLAMRVLSEAALAPETIRALLAVISREVSLVGVAQMTDLYHGVTRQPVGPAHIKTLYVYKTGRYTFSLPMILGATMAGVAEDVRATLGEAGELFGYVFQLKDDELGVFADEDTLGKPVGSDIGSNKKTLLRHRLFEKAGPDEVSRLERVFGSVPVDSHDLEYVRRLIEELGVRSEIEAEMIDSTEQAVRILRGAAPDADLSVFEGLAEYNLTRTG